MAGYLLRQEVKVDNNINEQNILIQAMNKSNVPKFYKDDKLLFQQLITDLFPNSKQVQYRDQVFYQKVNEVLTSNRILFEEEEEHEQKEKYIQKIVELKDTMEIRFGVMIIGEANSGKSSLIRLLKQIVNQKVGIISLNPKCIRLGELYGEVDEYTQEWKDGLASSIIREKNNQNEQDQWIVFDGPIDSLWIENMNTVLDDNKLLCLANGERIKLQNHLKLLFEVENVDMASPATISRCGVIYMHKDTLELKQYIRKKLGGFDVMAEIKSLILQYFDNTFFSFTQFLDRQIYRTNYIQNIQSMLNLIEYYIGLLQNYSVMNDQLKQRIEYIYSYCLIWGLLASHRIGSQMRLKLLFIDTFRQTFVPECQSVFDFQLNESSLNQFVLWDKLIQPYQH